MKITKDYLKRLIKEEIKQKREKSLNSFLRSLREFLLRLDVIDDNTNIFEEWDSMNQPEITTSKMFDSVSLELEDFIEDEYPDH